MSRYLAIDPGNAESAYVEFRRAPGPKGPPGAITGFGKVPNHDMIALLDRFDTTPMLAVEMVASYGMPVGREVFETCVWIGRFIERWAGPHRFVYRKDVKMHLCGNTTAKDSNIRRAVMDLWGTGRGVIGTSKSPGPLHGITKDVWSALAVAITASKLPQQE